MDGSIPDIGARDGQSARQWLLVNVEKLPKPNRAAFVKVQPPPDSELESYRIVEKPELRAEIAASGLGLLVQRPGPGNWKKTKPPVYIMKIYPSFDAPSDRARPVVTRRPRTAPATATGPVQGTVIRELRSKWEQYYLDSRPARRREHEERADTADPSDITSYAHQLLSKAKREKRMMTARDAILQATEEMTADFETVLRRRYGDIIVDVFGIPSD
jgi:hypothetical protein